MRGYGQFCPVAKSAEILGERWMLLLARELLMGSTRFKQLQRGLGRISPSVLSDRLKRLEENDIIYRERTGDGWEYHLTDCGRSLKPVVDAVGLWGYRWLRSEIAAEDLDIDLLMLDISRRLRVDRIRGEQAVIEFEFTDVSDRYRTWWLLIEGDEVELCYDHPGRKVSLKLRSRLETMAQIWMGRLSIASARRNRLLEVEGERRLSGNLTEWLSRSYVAELAAGSQALSRE
jgi:DNA-binding HxlR family transcriptional regulator